MKVSIIIANWNGRDMLERCLNSIFKQTFSSFEVVVVDNGSNDQSVEMVREKFKKVNLICLESNRGYSEANNIGYSESSGEFIALLNNDIVLDKEWLKSALRCFEQNNEDLAAIATKIIQEHDHTKIDSAGFEFIAAGTVHDYKGRAVTDGLVNQRREVFGPVASAALYRRSAIEKTWLFDNRYFAYYEDTDLAFRLRLCGYYTLYEPGAVSYHLGSATGKMHSPFHVRHARRNIEFLFLTDMQGYLFYKYFLIHWVYECLNFLFFVLKGRGWSFLRGKFGALTSLPWLFKQRRDLRKRIPDFKKNLRLVEQRFFSIKYLLNKFSRAQKILLKTDT